MIDFKPSATEAPKMSRRPSSRWTWGASLAVILAGGVAAAIITASDHGNPAKPTAAIAAPAAAPGVPVSVAVVEQHDTAMWNDFSGRVEAVGRVEIRPRVAGAITATHFREGALVKQGDPLFTIDPAPYEAAVRRDEANVAAAGARLILAAREQQRGKTLVGTSDLAVHELDTRVNEFTAAQANVQATQAALDMSRLDLGWTEVRAPISGRVGKIEVTPGNLVPAGAGAPSADHARVRRSDLRQFRGGRAIRRTGFGDPAVRGRIWPPSLDRIPVRDANADQCGNPIVGKASCN